MFFALGHGLVVVLLAVGIGRLLAQHFAFAGPWTLIAIGFVNLWRLFRNHRKPSEISRPIVAQPLVLGMLLAAGFETSSQLSALIIAGQTNAWIVGGLFSLGMVLVDGLDGLLATSTQRLATAGKARAEAASFALGLLVVIFALGLGGAELAGVELDRFALPLGGMLFVVVIIVRVWARSDATDFREDSLIIGDADA